MNIRPRHQTLQHQTQSMHYVNMYALRDRIDLSWYMDTVTTQSSCDPSTLAIHILPSAEDHHNIMENFAILAGRILHEHIPALKKIPHLTMDHIKHTHYKEMSSRSSIVSLIINLCNIYCNTTTVTNVCM